jgi:hypothetical protein
MRSNDGGARGAPIRIDIADRGAIDAAIGSSWRVGFEPAVQPTDRVLRRRDRFAAMALRLRQGEQRECARNDERASHTPGLAYV